MRFQDQQITLDMVESITQAGFIKILPNETLGQIIILQKAIMNASKEKVIVDIVSLK